MAAPKLALGFAGTDAVTVTVTLATDDGTEAAEPHQFTAPLDGPTLDDLRWYLETYAAHYTIDLDDQRADRIAAALKTWGGALYEAAFAGTGAGRLVDRFLADGQDGRLITISSRHPAVLGLPWELLRDPTGTFLFLETPRISVRRSLPGGGGGRKGHTAKPKDRLHILFVVSRPEGAAFIDPRADTKAVLDAIEAHAPGRVTWEFLRPATRQGLTDRLDDHERPAVDILHFDGHGAYGTIAGDAGGGSAADLLKGDPAGPQGYLVFETPDGRVDPVPADLLGDLLNRKQVALTVLSACQSAKVAGTDPMDSVAARLLHGGLPTVLAMTHSVLVATVERLFGRFYQELARGKAIGPALDTARQQLYLDPARGERRRGETQRVTLKLQDWFVPALYQAGADTPLLTTSAPPAPAAPPPAGAGTDGRLPARQESGFHGRAFELWQIERRLVAGTRRLVLHGFGGQGKTALAVEAGRWLRRTGLVDRVCFVSYQAFQGTDPTGVAVASLGCVLDRSLLDAAAATAALAECPTLVILDNLEDLTGAPLAALLAAAAAWSAAGASRVLVTTRMAELGHPDWPTAGTNLCRYLPLDGLRPDDAVAWFQELVKLPPDPTVPLPERPALETLFARVRHHPLSVEILARELKHRRPAALGTRLEALLADRDDPLVASLTLSLDRLDPASRALLPRLALFQGGAWEPMIPRVCAVTDAQWPPLRQALQQTGLVRAEPLGGDLPPFLAFHPTLAPALAPQLAADARASLAERYRQDYHQLSRELYQLDDTAPAAARAIARRELANLLAAVHAAFDAGAAEAVEFAETVARFLGVFGLDRDRAALTERAQTAAGTPGSRGWYLARSTHGEQFFAGGRFAEAAAVFEEVLGGLGPTPSFERCATVMRLARCDRAQGKLPEAEQRQRTALAEGATLPGSDAVRRLLSTCQQDLGDVLRDRGDLDGAKAAHEAALETKRDLGDTRGAAVSLFQLGTIAYLQRDLAAAAKAYQEARETFSSLGEPAAVATAWHQLGLVHQEARQWPAAEQAFRESGRIREAHGDRRGAAMSWDLFALVLEATGRPQEAERWYRRALEVRQAEGDRVGAAKTLNNLADLLKDQDGRLGDARTHAEQALAIDQTLDPAAAEIWKTYTILASIADRAGDGATARPWRRQARESYAAAPHAAETRRRFDPVIAAVVAAVRDPGQRPALAPLLAQLTEVGGGNLVAAVRGILDGARAADALLEPLDYEDAVIARAILDRLDAGGAAEPS